MQKILLIGTIMMVLVACGSGSPKYGDNTSKVLDNMIENKSFEIISSSAQPLMTAAMQQLGNAGVFVNGSTAGNINLTTNANYLRMKNDSVMADLPFYGERQFGGGYNNASGIEFEGIPNNLQIKKVKDLDYEISFDIHDKNSNTENYQVYIKLFPNLSSSMVIRSTNRSNIQFRGQVRELDSDK
ncbi:DUF4251 domain-containing protein [Confluentibacter flavum]|uniref:DUF4251 domain-containing protein n=1 Tax=Confluentibacter flavum TaxID=1909700 RepID=A0A2N3HPV7_9FLAO|nr:DUF4251 domain-containing protein [Confluentibacter flavum]PKQ46996.1 hypothetical protein CSW08_00060 [Confluentibacter flavum]